MPDDKQHSDDEIKSAAGRAANGLEFLRTQDAYLNNARPPVILDALDTALAAMKELRAHPDKEHRTEANATLDRAIKATSAIPRLGNRLREIKTRFDEHKPSAIHTTATQKAERPQGLSVPDNAQAALRYYKQHRDKLHPKPKPESGLRFGAISRPPIDPKEHKHDKDPERDPAATQPDTASIPQETPYIPDGALGELHPQQNFPKPEKPAGQRR